MIDTLSVFIKAVVFCHFGLSLMVETVYQYRFFVEEHFIDWCSGGPCFNETSFFNLHGPIFEEFFVTAFQDTNDLMCGLHAH